MLDARMGVDTVLVAPGAVATSATATARLDCAGAQHASIRIMFGAELNTNAVGPTINLLHCDTTVVTSFVTIVAAREAEDLTAAKEVRYEVDLRGKKRYLRLTVAPGTATNDTITMAAIATLSRNPEEPGSTTDMGDDVVVEV